LDCKKKDVDILGKTKKWLKYELPKKYQRKTNNQLCVGQKQIWFLLRLISNDQSINLCTSKNQEFDAWEWVSYWHPINQVVSFKQGVYRQALSEFSQINARFQKRRKRG
jgi:putative (di)nucleoside polyphosphate hydrolase